MSRRHDRDLAAALATGAGAGALRHQSHLDPAAVTAKTDPTDVVTAADREAERWIVDLLGDERPDDGVLGEEGAVRLGTSGRTWVIDPVDGTYNFVRGSDRWCTAVALVDEHTDRSGPVVSAIAAPRLGQLWVGGRDVPLTVNREPVGPLTDRPLAEVNLLTYLHPPHHATAVGALWRELVAGVATLRMTGSGSLDATDVACGRADLIVQHGVPDWDRLPGEAMIRASGGTARTVQSCGVNWYVAGAPTAVAEAVALLGGGAGVSGDR